MHLKPYTIFSDNDKMNTSGYSNQMPVKKYGERRCIRSKTRRPYSTSTDGGVTYTNKEDEKTEIKHQ